MKTAAETTSRTCLELDLGLSGGAIVSSFKELTVPVTVHSGNHGWYDRGVLPRTYETQTHCSVARALEAVGERWTMLIVRDAFRGLTRFGQFERSLGIPKKVLADRLDKLVGEGILERYPYQQRPPRHAYVLTDKGRGLWRAMTLLMLWGDEHYPAEGGQVPRKLEHRDCGGTSDERFHCTRCGAQLELEDVRLVAGPALQAAA